MPIEERHHPDVTWVCYREGDAEDGVHAIYVPAEKSIVFPEDNSRIDGVETLEDGHKALTERGFRFAVVGA